MGLEAEEQQQVVEILSCKLGSFPMKYLGMPISDCKISKAQLKFVTDETGKRLGHGNVTICLLEANQF